MPRLKPRRLFTKLDALTLLVAEGGAVGLNYIGWPVGGFGTFADPLTSSFRRVQVSVQIVVPHLMMLSLAMLVVRLQSPRPSRIRLSCQPGFVASVAASAAILVDASWIVPLKLMGSRVILNQIVFANYSTEVSFAVLASWVVLWMSGRVRLERTWVDLAGTAVGIAWIAVTALYWSMYFTRY